MGPSANALFVKHKLPADERPTDISHEERSQYEHPTFSIRVEVSYETSYHTIYSHALNTVFADFHASRGHICFT